MAKAEIILGASGGGGGELFNEFSQSGADTISEEIDTGLSTINRLYVIWTGTTSANLYGASIYDSDKSTTKQFAGGCQASTGQGNCINIGDTANHNMMAKIMSVTSGKFKIKNPHIADTYNYKWYAE